jgi:acyl phosphate:glycerol-3-phosphate acyltransferase
VLRTGHRMAALLTLVGDGVKGFVAVFVAQHLAPLLGAPDWSVAAAGLAVFIGHLYPVFHRFAGGKGVATAAGVVLALHWPLGVALTVLWLTMALGFRISSLAALTTAVLLPLGLFYARGPGADAFVGVIMAVLLFWRHRVNIRQLLRGRERTIGQ